MVDRPRFIRPGGNDSLYPSKNKEGFIETLVNPNVDVALTGDSDSRTSVVYNRYHHLPLDEQRKKLPVFQYRSHILYLLENYQTLVLVGETGCGKSTQVPQYLLEVGYTVCVTQPRVAAALSLASRVASERGVSLGSTLGYAAGSISVCGPDTKCKNLPHSDSVITISLMDLLKNSILTFVTEGVLLREMFASPLLMQYSCIMLDEVHERTLMTDVLMGLLKKIAKKRKNLKLIISSATMDAEFLMDFFNLKSGKERNNSSTSVIISMQGRTHPIDIFYVQEPVPDYVKAAVDTVIKIHENEPFGNILAFLTSQEDIHSANETLQQYAIDNNEKHKHRQRFPSGMKSSALSVVCLYGRLPAWRQLQALQVNNTARTVVLSTNVAETSLTVQGVVYVIDSGFHKLPHFDPTIGVECLSTCPIAKANAMQRAGRAGRTCRGKCYRLYTESEYEKLPPSVPPEICRSDLSSVLLQLKALGINNLLKFTFPTPPPAKLLLAGIESLFALQAIDKQGDLTPALGVLMAELPMRPMAAKMLCSSGEFGCVKEALLIVSMLQVDSVFIQSNSRKTNMAARASRRNNFEVAEGDIVMYLNIFDSYLKVKARQPDERKAQKACKQWCQAKFINHKVMEKACEIRDNLEKLIRKFNIEEKEFEGPDLGSGKLQRVMKCVLSGYFPQAAYLTPNGTYKGVRGAILNIGTDSCLYNVQQPKWVIFANVQTIGDKTFMRDLMTIDKQWLLEVAPHYYKEN